MGKYSKRAPTSPGEILLEEFLKPLGLSQSAFARHIGWSQPKVNEIISDKRGITPETAMVFSDAFGTTPQFWLNAQQAVDLWNVKQSHRKVKRLPQMGDADFENLGFTGTFGF